MNLTDTLINGWIQLSAGVGAEALAQLGLVLLALPLARRLASPLRRALGEASPRERLQAPASALASQMPSLCWVGLLFLMQVGARAGAWPSRVIDVALSMVLAWFVVGVVSRSISNATLARPIAVMVWAVAALEVLGWLGPTIAILDQMTISVGVIEISALGVVKAITSLAILLWVAMLTADVVEHRLSGVEGFSPSVQVLLGKLTRTGLVGLALLLALSSAGLDLSALAMFGGAVGLGIGFGLQKVVSNLVSGLILLLDKSIKPGDVIAVADYYGRVDALGARYVSVITRDGTEHLIPNEELITSRVENWSHSQSLLRVRVPVGVHYKSDLKLAIQLCLQAAAETDRILDEPATVCHLRGFGDSSVDLEIRFWINDPMNGRANVTSQMLMRVWTKFHEHGIEIPYPQRDLHIRTPHPSIEVKLPEGNGSGGGV